MIQGGNFSELMGSYIPFKIEALQEFYSVLTLKRLLKVLVPLFAVFVSPDVNSQHLVTPLTYSIVQPVIKTTRPPVLIILHGYGSDENDFMDLAKSVDGRFMKFSLRAPIIMHPGAYCWYQLNFLNNGDFTYKYEEVKKSRDLVLAFISQACKIYKLDSNSVYLMGFSQGAILSYELALFSPMKIKGILPLSGRLMKESMEHKASATQISKLRIFIAHGTQDERIRVNESEKALEYLKDKNVNVIFKKYPIGHTVSAEEVGDIKTFLSAGLTN